MVLKQQEYFPKEKLKGTQSTNNWEKKEKLYFINSPPFSNVLGVKQNSPGLLFLTNPRFSHQSGTKSSLTRVLRR